MNATLENKIKDGVNSGVKGSLDSPNVGRNQGGLRWWLLEDM